MCFISDLQKQVTLSESIFSHFYSYFRVGSWKDSKDCESGGATNRSSNNGDTKPRDEVEPDLKQSSNK